MLTITPRTMNCTNAQFAFMFVRSVFRGRANNHSRAPHHHADPHTAAPGATAAVLKRDQKRAMCNEGTSRLIVFAEREAARHHIVNRRLTRDRRGPAVHSWRPARPPCPGLRPASPGLLSAKLIRHALSRRVIEFQTRIKNDFKRADGFLRRPLWYSALSASMLPGNVAAGLTAPARSSCPSCRAADDRWDDAARSLWRA